MFDRNREWLTTLIIRFVMISSWGFVLVIRIFFVLESKIIVRNNLFWNNLFDVNLDMMVVKFLCSNLSLIV